jgi:hypothetical protein
MESFSKKNNSFVGKPCPKCSGTLRYINGERCITCSKAYHNTTGKILRKVYKQTEKGKQTIKRYSNSTKRKLKEKEYILKKRYNISLEEWNNTVLKQGNKCIICCEPFIKTPHVDHDHLTGKVRGLLCNVCNRGIGYLKDNPIIVRRAAEYLENNNEHLDGNNL